jgi:hypothetical protein
MGRPLGIAVDALEVAAYEGPSDPVDDLAEVIDEEVDAVGGELPVDDWGLGADLADEDSRGRAGWSEARCGASGGSR